MPGSSTGLLARGASTTGAISIQLLGTNTGGIADISDHGFQLQASAMVMRSPAGLRLSGSEIFGDYGDASEIRAGINWYSRKSATFASTRNGFT